MPAPLLGEVIALALAIAVILAVVLNPQVARGYEAPRSKRTLRHSEAANPPRLLKTSLKWPWWACV